MKIKDRIVGLRRIKAKDLIPNPLNWRRHPEAQASALRGVLDEIGWVAAVIVRETSVGYQIIDGHLRASISPEEEVPVLVLDLTEDEAAKALAVIDPIGAMAETDNVALANLVDSLNFMHDISIPELDQLCELPESEKLKLNYSESGNFVGAYFSVSDLAICERAIRATTKANRGEALVEICRSFLNAER